MRTNSFFFSFFRSCYSKSQPPTLALGRDSDRHGNGKALHKSEKKGEVSGLLWLEMAGLGNLDGLLETEVFYATGLGSLDRFLWWSWIGSRVLTSPACSGPIAAEVVIWLPWAAYVIQSSVVTFGLAIVHLYSLPFRTLRERHWVSGVAFIQVSFLP